MINYKTMSIYIKITAALFLSVLLLVAGGCTRGDAYILQPQWFQDVEVMVEIRPEKPQVGANEFIMITTYKDKRPGFDFIISIKIQGDKEWRQGIQDGRSGVYRRAINIKDPVNDVLLVQVVKVKSKERGVLKFPLNVQLKE